MNKLLLLLSFALLLAWVPVDAEASGISDRLNSSLDAMANYTPPGVHESNRRTVISGGSLSVKLQSGRVDAFGFRAPSISVGCGGIDAFFGAFSMVSKEVVVQALRAIVSGVLQYAFRVALKVLCQSCEQIMGTISDALAKANQYLGDMCNATNMFLETNVGQVDDVANKIRSQMGLNASGGSDDAADAKKQGSWISSVGSFVNSLPGPVSESLPEYGNHIYNAVKKSEGNVFYFLGTDHTFYEEIMSLVGAQVVCAESVGSGCPGRVDGPNVSSSQEGETHTNTYYPVLGFEYLVLGDTGTVNEAGGSIGAAIWKCNDTGGDTPCLAPSAGTLDNYVSVYDRMLNAFLGSDGKSGILYKLRYNYTEAMTAEEERWMIGGGNIVGMLIDLGTKDYQTARDWLLEYGELIAADYTYTLIYDSLVKVRQAMAEQSSNKLATQNELLNTAFDNIRADYSKIQERHQGRSVAFDAYMSRLQALSARN